MPLALVHRRLAHFNEETIKKMVKARAISCVLSDTKACDCEVCRVSKAKRNHVPEDREQERDDDLKPFSRIWSDVKGKVRPKDFWGNQYVVTFTYEKTRWVYVDFNGVGGRAPAGSSQAGAPAGALRFPVPAGAVAAGAHRHLAQAPGGCLSPGDPRGFKVALRFDTAVLHWTQGNNTGTLLALTPRSNQKETAQLIEITTISHFPRLGLTLKH